MRPKIIERKKRRVGTTPKNNGTAYKTNEKRESHKHIHRFVQDGKKKKKKKQTLVMYKMYNPWKKKMYDNNMLTHE